MTKKRVRTSTMDGSLARGFATACPRCGREAGCECAERDVERTQDLVLPSERLAQRFSRRYEGWQPSTAHR